MTEADRVAKVCSVHEGIERDLSWLKITTERIEKQVSQLKGLVIGALIAIVVNLIMFLLTNSFALKGVRDFAGRF